LVQGFFDLDPASLHLGRDSLYYYETTSRRIVEVEKVTFSYHLTTISFTDSFLVPFSERFTK